ncbi:hypothetical protein [Amycolatopsis sp. CA-230715]|uniref:hypothetical protein n=1 Tax=Amycolatopsis sp. CA-230715 TaxID=2745196 RepID=UPI001C01CB54|nr:hypothetical protein [Amycolatopsis sp. CA-230715]QWF82744.1 hypothetical protein HUW46_06183 [Amycolatopsis sp. CA-230715]
MDTAVDRQPEELLDPDVHDQLLWLAGRAPDGWLAVAREELGVGDHDRVEELLAALDPVLDARAPRRYRFTPDGDVPYEAIDAAVVEAVRGDEETVACWASMRDGVDRVYLVQAEYDADLAGITLDVQRAVGEDEIPRVEVFAPDTALSSYHETALLAAVLLWTRDPFGEVKIARTFDGASAESGPWFAPSHELVADPGERQRLLDFFDGGEVLVETEVRMTDLVSGSAGAVPSGLRTDGGWVWSDATRYYLERHLLAPDTELARYALAAPPGRTLLSPLDRYRALTALNPENEEGPLWPAG